jgi:hypothetical protein
MPLATHNHFQKWGCMQSTCTSFSFVVTISVHAYRE